MEVDYTNNFGEEYDSLEERYTHLAEVTFKMLDVQTNYEIDVSLVDDETIHQINRDYRHVDRVTDVISFAFNDDKDPTEPSVDDIVNTEPDLASNYHFGPAFGQDIFS